MTKTISPIEAHEKIVAYTKTTNQAVRRCEKPFAVRQWARQGDCYFVAIAAIPNNAKAVAASVEVQLAQGATKGSRHMLQMRPGVTFYRLTNPTPLDGGYIKATDRCYISHPEHAHLDLPPGIYAVTYQRDLAFEEIRAVRD
jgi:hypothetical protein